MIRSHEPPGRLRRDEGFTLIEMLVASILFAFVFLIAATIFISSIGVQRTVQDMSKATVEAQLGANSISRGVQNARGLELTGDTGAPTLVDGGDLMLVAKVATSDPLTIDYNCQAWYYDASAGQFRWRVTNLAAGEVLAPTEAELAGWTLLVDRVEPLDDPPLVLTHTGDSIEVAYQATIDDNSPVEIHFVVTPFAETPEPESTSECY